MRRTWPGKGQEGGVDYHQRKHIMNVTRITDGEIFYKGHGIVPVRYGQGDTYNWTVEIDGKERNAFCQSRSFAIRLAEDLIEQMDAFAPKGTSEEH